MMHFYFKFNLKLIIYSTYICFDDPAWIYNYKKFSQHLQPVNEINFFILLAKSIRFNWKKIMEEIFLFKTVGHILSYCILKIQLVDFFNTRTKNNSPNKLIKTDK